MEWGGTRLAQFRISLFPIPDLMQSRALPFLFVLLSSHALCAQMVGGASEDFFVATPASMPDSIAVGPDLNGDGIPEFAVGTGHLRLVEYFDGATGVLIDQVQRSGLENFGISIAFPADVDGDGLLDLAVGATHDGGTWQPNRGRLQILSSVTHAVLAEATGSVHEAFLGGGLVAVGDLDGDQVGDLMTTERIPGSWGLDLQLRSGANCQLIRSHRASDITGGDAAPDLDGDGVGDYFIRRRGLSVELCSGATGAVLRTHSEGISTDSFGSAAAATGDLDGDGVPDYAIGASNYSTTVGAVYAYSGATGQLLWLHEGDRERLFLGVLLVAVDDLDGDGVEDLLAPLSWFHHQYNFDGLVRLISGRDGSGLVDQFGGAPLANLGLVTARHADLDGDQRDEYLMFQSGGIRAVSMKPGMVADRRELSSAAGAQVHFTLRFPASEAGQSYRWLASLSGTGPESVGGVRIPLRFDALTQITLNRPLDPVVQNAAGVLGAHAEATVILDLAPGAAAAWTGRTLHFAAVTHSTGQPRISSVASPLLIQP